MRRSLSCWQTIIKTNIVKTCMAFVSAGGVQHTDKDTAAWVFFTYSYKIMSGFCTRACVRVCAVKLFLVWRFSRTGYTLKMGSTEVNSLKHNLRITLYWKIEWNIYFPLVLSINILFEYTFFAQFIKWNIYLPTNVFFCC